MKTLLRIILLASMCAAFTSQQAYAEGVCDAALVKSTYNSFSAEHLDWRLATLVTEKDYNEIKHDEGANAVIYGVPVGENYSDFEKTIHEKLKSHAESLTHDQAINILWTGLDANSPNLYTECLKTQVLSGRGVHLAIESATKSDISILVSWNPMMGDPPSITPHWIYRGDRSMLPSMLKQGFTTVVVPRPRLQQTFAVNYPGATGSVTLEPLVKLPILPPVLPFVTSVEPYRTKELASGQCKDFGGWMEVCSPDKPTDWTIASSSFALIGNRTACGAFSNCKNTTSSLTKVCWEFQTQGHDEECRMGHGNTGIQYTAGVLTVTWAHH
jgi:hypothetical protein